MQFREIFVCIQNLIFYLDQVKSGPTVFLFYLFIYLFIYLIRYLQSRKTESHGATEAAIYKVHVSEILEKYFMFS